MNRLTVERVLELSGHQFQNPTIVAVADSAASGIALIDPAGDGTRVVVEHYVRDKSGSWQAVTAHRQRPAESAAGPAGP